MRTHLIFVTRSLTVFSQTLKALVDKSHVGFINIQTEQSQATGSATADAVKKL